MTLGKATGDYLIKVCCSCKCATDGNAELTYRVNSQREARTQNMLYHVFPESEESEEQQ